MSSSRAGFFSHMGSVVDRYGGLAGSTIGSLILAFSGALAPSLENLLQYHRWQTLVVYGGAALAVLGACSLARASTKVEMLLSQNSQLRDLVKSLGTDIEEKWRHILIQIANECKLDNAGRISIYRHEGSNFIMLARFSTDPDKRKQEEDSTPLTRAVSAKRTGMASLSLYLYLTLLRKLTFKHIHSRGEFRQRSQPHSR